MSGMVERVAKAIYEKRNGAGCKPWSRQPWAHKQPYMADARAAIGEMETPTEAMRKAMSDADDQSVIHNYGGRLSPDDAYEIAISAALNEEG